MRYIIPITASTIQAIIALLKSIFHPHSNILKKMERLLAEKNILKFYGTSTTSPIGLLNITPINHIASDLRRLAKFQS